jgi:hypothetical protein
MTIYQQRPACAAGALRTRRYTFNLPAGRCRLSPAAPNTLHTKKRNLEKNGSLKITKRTHFAISPTPTAYYAPSSHPGVYVTGAPPRRHRCGEANKKSPGDHFLQGFPGHMRDA